MIFQTAIAIFALCFFARAQNIKTVMADTNGIIRGNAALEARIATGGTGAASTNDLAALSNRVVTVEAGTNSWNAAYGWGNHASAGYLTSFTEADPFFAAWRSTNTYVKVETDLAALAALSQYAATNQVKALHDSRATNYFQTVENGTGTVWVVAVSGVELTTTLSDDFLEITGGTRPVWTNNAWPFTDGSWSGGEGLEYTIIGPDDSLWRGAEVPPPGTFTNFPVTLFPEPSSPAFGTAVIHVTRVYCTTNVYSRFATEASVSNVNANLNACHISLSNQVETVRDDVDALPASLQPYALTAYGDLATTNTAGYAGFASTNGTLLSVQTVDPTNGQLLAQFRYDITNIVYGSANWSSWIQSAVGTPESVNFVRMLLYTPAGGLLASNDSPYVKILTTSASSNLVASLALPYAVTNGYLLTEIYSASNTTKNAFVHTGGSFTNTLTLSAKPLNYAVSEEFAWTSGALNGTNGTYRAVGTNVYWILTP